jgi:hypothetical protein
MGNFKPPAVPHKKPLVVSVNWLDGPGNGFPVKEAAPVTFNEGHQLCLQERGFPVNNEKKKEKCCALTM